MFGDNGDLIINVGDKAEHCQGRQPFQEFFFPFFFFLGLMQPNDQHRDFFSLLFILPFLAGA